MPKQFDSPTVSLTPDGKKGFIDFEGEADPNEIYDIIMERHSVEWWLITNIIGPQSFPVFGPYYLILDVSRQLWALRREWPDGGVVSGTESKGVLDDPRLLRGLLNTISDFRVEPRLRLINNVSKG